MKRRSHNSIPIYPFFTSRISQEGKGPKSFVLECFIRKQHTDGKWYLIPYRRSTVINADEPAHTVNWIVHDEHNRLNIEAYKAVVAGVIVPGHKELEFILDENQKDEKELIFEI